MPRFETFIETTLTLAEELQGVVKEFLKEPYKIVQNSKGEVLGKEFNIEGSARASQIVKEMHKVAMDIREMLRRDTQGILSMEEAIALRDAMLQVIELYVPARKREDAKGELVERVGVILGGFNPPAVHPTLLQDQKQGGEDSSTEVLPPSEAPL